MSFFKVDDGGSIVKTCRVGTNSNMKFRVRMISWAAIRDSHIRPYNCQVAIKRRSIFVENFEVRHRRMSSFWVQVDPIFF